MTEPASQDAGKTEADKPAPIKFAEFLESVPPSAERTISDMIRLERHVSGAIIGFYLARPEIHIHCSSPQCNGFRFFRSLGDKMGLGTGRAQRNVFLAYECSNCKSNKKLFALRIFNPAEEDQPGAAIKYGELPLFGPPTPQRRHRLRPLGGAAGGKT